MQKLNGLLLLIFSLLGSCKNDNQKPAEEYSPYFNAQITLADKFIDEGQPKKAFKLLDSVVKTQHITLKDKFAYYGFYFAYHYKYSRDLNKASLYADSMQYFVNTQANKENFLREDAEAKYAKGDILFDMQHYNDAYQNYFNARLIGKSAVDDCNLSDYSFRMGMILYKQANFLLAAEYFTQSYKEGQACPDNFVKFFRKQQVLDNIALCYYKSRDLDKALAYFNSAEEVLESGGALYPDKKIFIETAKGVIYGNQAQVLTDKGLFKEAERLFKKSIAINTQKSHDAADAHLAMLHLANLYLQQKKYSAAATTLQRAQRFRPVKADHNAKLEWLRLMWKYHDGLSMPLEGYKYLSAYTHLKDSVAAAMRGLTETRADEQLKNLERQYENSILRKDNVLNTLYLNIAIGTAIFCLVIIFLVLRNSRNTKKNIKSLRMLNKKMLEQKQQLEITLAELEKSGSEKDRILRAVAHDLRNPIGGVASLASLFLDESNLSDEQREMVSLIQSTCQDALQLIHEILELIVLADTESLPRRLVDINALLINTAELLKFKADEKQQRILVNKLGDAQTVLISREKIARVIANLIGNAIKFSGRGSDIEVTVKDMGEAIQIAIKDSGIGIPDNLKDKIFDTFSEAKRVGTSGEKPFGLGLSISRQIVEAHNGRLWFESAVGIGSTFYVELDKPVAEAEALNHTYYAEENDQR